MIAVGKTQRTGLFLRFSPTMLINIIMQTIQIIQDEECQHNSHTKSSHSTNNTLKSKNISYTYTSLWSFTVVTETQFTVAQIHLEHNLYANPSHYQHGEALRFHFADGYLGQTKIFIA